MKVLSMIQPWASLFVLGETQYETRTWRTNYRGPLAIHTSKKVDRHSCSNPNIHNLLAKHGYTASNLPTGVIIGTCILKNCIKVTENHNTWALLEDGRIVEGNDLFLGDYRVGGYVWEVENMKLLEEFLPAKGQLGIWEYNEDSQNSPK
jgi:activating signal cointegrator 1